MQYCAEPDCAAIVQAGRCPAHAAARERARENTDVRRWYHLARWRHPVYGLRALALRRDPLCIDCLAAGRAVASTDADHERPHRGDPRLFWDLENLRGRCHRCHARKTQSGQ